EIDVAVDRKAHARQDAMLVEHLLAAQAGRFSKVQPRLNASFASLPSIMVDDSLEPFTALFASREFRQDNGVFDRDILLIIEAIQYPTAELILIKPAFMHSNMKGMFVVVFRFSDRPESLDKFVPRPELFHFRPPHASCPIRPRYLCRSEIGAPRNFHPARGLCC